MSRDAPLRAVVTGAGSGLGRALALDVARRGGRVLVSDVDMGGAEETRRMVRDAGAEAWAVRADVRELAEVEALLAAADRYLGGADLIANNAGVAAGGPFEQISLEDFRWAVEINLWGVIHGCRVFVPRFKSAGRGYVLNVASMAGLCPPPEMAPYNVTKAGVVALSETLYAELKEHGVHVTVVCPMYFVSRIAESARGIDHEGRKLAQGLMRRSRWKPPDVARQAIDAALEGTLYALPMRSGRALWRLKRAAPTRFHDLMAYGAQSVRKVLRRGS